MKEGFEVELPEKGEDTAIDQSLRCPVEWGSGQRAEEQHRGEICQQSGCVFQESNVESRPDAESTRMEGKGRGWPEARGPRHEVRRRLAFSGEVYRRGCLDLLRAAAARGYHRIAGRRFPEISAAPRLIGGRGVDRRTLAALRC